MAAAAELKEVSCASVSFCMATGYASDAKSVSLTELWNGQFWRVTPGVPVGALALSCPSANWCMAVGGRSDSTVTYSQTERWSGSSWAVIPSPNQGVGGSSLDGISCLSSSFCQAVGWRWTVPGPGPPWLNPTQSTAMLWNGIRWSLEPTPAARRNTQASLSAVSCTSTRSCVAVGAWTTSARADYGQLGGTVVRRWRNGVWSIQPSPDRVDLRRLTALSGVSCFGPKQFECLCTVSQRHRARLERNA